MQVSTLATSSNAGVATEDGVELKSLPNLLSSVDIVSLHLALNEFTRGMLGPAQLRLLQPGAVLVNTARGELVDEEALLAALDDGAIGCACLDVFDKEGLPLAPTVKRLASHPSVVATPHLGGSTLEAREAVAQQLAQSIAKALGVAAP